jgi:hypothetical protein
MASLATLGGGLMARIDTCYRDNSGAAHEVPEDAALADLEAVLGRIGAESGLTKGLAKMILDKRADIEAVFADLDMMISPDGVTGNRAG